MKWSELSTEQRDRLVWEKVFGNPAICIGQLITERKDNPDKSGGIAWTYYQATCINCEFGCSYMDKEAAPKQHRPVYSDMPHYSTDMNAALSGLLHIGRRFHFVYNPNPVAGGVKFSCKIEPASDEEWSAIGNSDDPAEAMNLAALKACGIEIEP